MNYMSLVMPSNCQGHQESARVTCNSIQSRALTMQGHARCIFSIKFVGGSNVADRRDGKHAAKVFFGCFDQTTSLKKERNRRVVVWSKHPKDTFAAYFPRSGTMTSK